MKPLLPPIGHLGHDLLRVAMSVSLALPVLGTPASALASADARHETAGLARNRDQPESPAPEARRDPVSDQFGSKLLDEPLATGPLGFSAQRAWIWNHPAGSRDPHAVRRVHLTGNVALQIGGTRVDADRATIWMQLVPTARSGISGELYQIYAFLDNARASAQTSGGKTRADRLQLQGLLLATSKPKLRVDLGSGGQPTAKSEVRFIEEAQEELSKLLGPADPDPAKPGTARPGTSRPGTIEPAPGGDSGGTQTQASPSQSPRQADPGSGETDPGQTDASPAQPAGGQSTGPSANRQPTQNTATELPPVFSQGSIIYLATGDRVTAATIEGRRVVIASGGVIVQVSDPSRPTGAPGAGGTELTAQRAVITLKNAQDDDASLASGLAADSVESIYLEGGVVAGDGTYTIRAPRAFYDVSANRGVLVDGVLWTYDQRRRLPIYVRAERFKQIAEGQWDVSKAVVSNSPSPVPGLGIGARRATVNTQGAGEGLEVDARDITLRLGGLPVAYWPRYHGDATQPALQSVRIDDSNREGFAIKTSWDMLTLLGVDRDQFEPTELSASGDLDYYAERGIGLGADLSWKRPDGRGRFTGYILPNDTGTDVLYNGTRAGRDGEVRGFARFEQRLELNASWELLTEGVWISDEAFIPAFDPRFGRESRELTNRATLRRASEDSLLTVELSGTFLDFQPNEYLLQSQGYSVGKAPEIRYVSGLTDILQDSAPGVFTYNWEASAGLMRLSLSEIRARDLGYVSNARAMAALGLLASESLGDALRADGLNEDFVSRFDTRHELAAQLKLGAISVTPFVVGRVTLYDTSFGDFSPDESDEIRFWGAAGIDLWTELVKINDAAESRFFDIHRLRHVIEPRLTMMVSETSLDSDDLPVYDDEIESLVDGVLIRAAVDQTWQTKRGGPGRWRNVDVFSLRTAYVWASEGATRESPLPDFVLARPELSNPGEYLSAEATWYTTEAVAVAGESIFDLETNQQARTSAGIIIRHTPVFTTTGEIRFINPRDATYGTLSALYQLTEKYNTSLRAVYDFDQSDFQSIGVTLERKFQAGSFYVSVSHNNIRDETSFGISYSPLGLGTRLGTQAFGRDLNF